MAGLFMPIRCNGCDIERFGFDAKLCMYSECRRVYCWTCQVHHTARCEDAKPFVDKGVATP